MKRGCNDTEEHRHHRRCSSSKVIQFPGGTTKRVNKPTGQASKLRSKDVNKGKVLQTARQTKPADDDKQKSELPTTRAATPEPPQP